MARKKYGLEQSIAKLREADVLLSLLNTVSAAAVPNLQLVAFWMPFAIGTCSAVRPSGRSWNSQVAEGEGCPDSPRCCWDPRRALITACRHRVLVARQAASAPQSDFTALRTGEPPSLLGNCDTQHQAFFSGTGLRL